MRVSAKMVVLVLLCASAWAQSQQAGKKERFVLEPPMLGVHYARGQGRPFGGGGGSSPDMTYHGGSILPGAATHAIFWGSSWSSSDTPAWIDTWYNGAIGSTYAMSSDEYTDSNGDSVHSATLTYSGHTNDSSPAPTKAPSTSAVLSKVCKLATAGDFTLVANGYYPVYVDQPRGHTSYCAWHSWGSCGSTPIEFGFFFNMLTTSGSNVTATNIDQGCNAYYPDTSLPNTYPVTGTFPYSIQAAALANVTGHEFSETRSDPQGASWYDNSGSENADKCAWTFSDPGTPDLDLSNTYWMIQGNWSNTAYNYDASTANGTTVPYIGYANSSGQRGCIDGSTSYPAVVSW